MAALPFAVRRSPRRRRRARVRAEAGRAAAADVRRPRHRHLDQQRGDGRAPARASAADASSSTTTIRAASASARRCIELHDELLDGDAAADRRVPVRERLPGCVGPIGNTGPLAKVAALRILDCCSARQAEAQRTRGSARSCGPASTATRRSCRFELARRSHPRHRRAASRGATAGLPPSGAARGCPPGAAQRLQPATPMPMSPRPRRSAWRGRGRCSSSIDGGSRRRLTARSESARWRRGSTVPRARRRCSPAARGAAAVHVLRPGDHRAQRRRGHAGIPRRLRVVRRDGAFVTRQFLLARHADERTLLEAVADGARARWRAGQLQRQVVRRAAARGALSVPPPRLARARHASRRRAASRRGGSGSQRARGCATIPAARRAPLGRPSTGFAVRCRRWNGSSSACAGTGDVPGFEIPARYFQFVRSGDARAARPRCSSTTDSIC